jgi:hypothetical protein
MISQNHPSRESAKVCSRRVVSELTQIRNDIAIYEKSRRNRERQRQPATRHAGVGTRSLLEGDCGFKNAT